MVFSVSLARDTDHDRSTAVRPVGSTNRTLRATPRRTRDDGNRMAALRHALSSWAVHSRDRETVVVPMGPSTDGGPDRSPTPTECWSIAEVVYALWDDREPLPAGVCVALHLEDGLTFSDLSRQLFVLWTEDGDIDHYSQAMEFLVLQGRLERPRVDHHAGDGPG